MGWWRKWNIFANEDWTGQISLKLLRKIAQSRTTDRTPGRPPVGRYQRCNNKANQRTGQTVTDNSWFNYPAATPSTVSYTADALNRYTAVGAVTPSYDGTAI